MLFDDEFALVQALTGLKKTANDENLWNQINKQQLFNAAWDERVPWCLYDKLDDNDLTERQSAFKKRLMRRDALVHRTAADLVSSIQEAVPTAIFLKGFPLLCLYPSEMSRFMADLDVIVPDVATARRLMALLAQRGYGFSAFLLNFKNGREIGECQFRQDGLLSVGLHIGAYPITAGQILNIDLWQRATTVHHKDITFKMPCYEDMLLILGSHIYRHGVFRLRDELDIIAILQASGSKFDWSYCLAKSFENGLVPVLHNLLKAAIETDRIRIPNDVRQQFEKGRFGNNLALALYHRRSQHRHWPAAKLRAWFVAHRTSSLRGMFFLLREMIRVGIDTAGRKLSVPSLQFFSAEEGVSDIVITPKNLYMKTNHVDEAYIEDLAQFLVHTFAT